MSTYLYRLEFTGPIHFGQTGIGLEEASERLPSDSLASALINAAAVAGKLESFLSMFQGRDPALRLSSLFPFGPDPAQNGRSGYLVPRPLMMPPLADSSILGSMGKDLKRLKYLKAQDAWHWLAGPPLKPGELELFLKRNQTLGGRWDPEKQTGWWAEELRPRVALDRSSQNSSIWWCGSLRFVPGAGLYGLIRVHDSVKLSELEGIFRVLGDMGLGGERTYGMGGFEFSGFEAPGDAWPGAEGPSANLSLLMSRCYPASDERPQLARILEAWDFVETRGYVVSGRHATTLKRKRVGMLREGSLARQPLRGAMLDVTPDAGEAMGLSHRVYRCGLGFWMSPGGAK